MERLLDLSADFFVLLRSEATGQTHVAAKLRTVKVEIHFAVTV